jgi:hypothetical protein
MIAPPLAPLIERHRQRPSERARHPGRIVRIDAEGGLDRGEFPLAERLAKEENLDCQRSSRATGTRQTTPLTTSRGSI